MELSPAIRLQDSSTHVLSAFHHPQGCCIARHVSGKQLLLNFTCNTVAVHADFNFRLEASNSLQNLAGRSQHTSLQGTHRSLHFEQQSAAVSAAAAATAPQLMAVGCGTCFCCIVSELHLQHP
jgi:hypothetical protein